jgi:hypothetical protein
LQQIMRSSSRSRPGRWPAAARPGRRDGRDVLKVAHLLIIAQLGVSSVQNLSTWASGPRVPIESKSTGEAKPPGFQPAGLDGSVGLHKNRPGGHHDIAAGHGVAVAPPSPRECRSFAHLGGVACARSAWMS